MEMKQSAELPNTYSQVQCVDCGNFYKNRNTLGSHRSTYCTKRLSLKMKKMNETKEVLLIPKGAMRSVVKKESGVCPSEDCGTCTACKDKIKSGGENLLKKSYFNRMCTNIPNRNYSTGGSGGTEHLFNEDDIAYWRDFEQSSL